MSKEVVETIYGKYHRFDVMKDSGGVFGAVKFYLRKDGEPYRGSYSSLAAAVRAAKEEG